MVLHYLFDLVVQNRDAQVRFKWNENDLVIWVSYNASAVDDPVIHPMTVADTLTAS
jgi:hypothetical protein